MNGRRMLVVSVVAGFLLVGCAQQQKTQLVKVCFTSPAALGDLDAHAYGFSGALPASHRGGTPHGAALASDSDSPTSSVPVFESAVQSAALWGGSYHGADVTFAQTPLSPGFYNFAYWDGSRDADLIGTIRVNAASSDLVQTFRRWKAGLTAQRQRAAYTFELNGQVEKASTSRFGKLTTRLEAIDAFEEELDDAIAHELARRDRGDRQQQALLSTAVVHLFPGGDTRYSEQAAAFGDQDFQHVATGQPVTKMVLVADHHEIQSRIDDINRVGQRLSYLKDSLRDEVRRLEGAKALRAIVFRNHEDFVKNETRLRQALADLDGVNQRLADLRSRRLALAFTAELFAPGTGFAPLQTELADLAQEKAVLNAEMDRVDALFARSNAVSPQRVQLERRRQRVGRALAELETQSAFVADARATLEQMRQDSAVLYRQGVLKMLVAATFDADIPTAVRDALERESVMVVRLQRRTTGTGGANDFPAAATAGWTESHPAPSTPSSSQSGTGQSVSRPAPRARTASYSPPQPMLEMQPE